MYICVSFSVLHVKKNPDVWLPFKTSKLWHYPRVSHILRFILGTKGPGVPAPCSHTAQLSPGSQMAWEGMESWGHMGPSPPQGRVQGFLQSPRPQAPGHPETQIEVQVLDFIRASALTVHSLGSCTPSFRCYSGQGAWPPTGDPGGTAPTCLRPSGPGWAYGPGRPTCIPSLWRSPGASHGDKGTYTERQSSLSTNMGSLPSPDHPWTELLQSCKLQGALLENSLFATVSWSWSLFLHCRLWTEHALTTS